MNFKLGWSGRNLSKPKQAGFLSWPKEYTKGNSDEFDFLLKSQSPGYEIGFFVALMRIMPTWLALNSVALFNFFFWTFQILTTGRPVKQKCLSRGNRIKIPGSQVKQLVVLTFSWLCFKLLQVLLGGWCNHW